MNFGSERRSDNAKKAYEFRLNRSFKSLSGEDVCGLDELISFLKDSRDSGLFEEVQNAFDLRHKFYLENKLPAYENMPSNSVYSFAHENLKFNILDLKVIRYDFVRLMYRIFEFKYYMTTQRNFDDCDVQNIYLSGLDERLIYALDRFDEITNWPQPSAEFFQKLKDVEWENKSTKKFRKNLHNLKVILSYTTRGLIKYEHLNLLENMFTQLMAGCCAVNDNRGFITKEDIVFGYKTYIKLLNIDITKYKARSIFNNGNVDMGYLVCDKCKEYYKLQAGESPEDFSDECECGGKLKYYKDIDWLKN